MMCRKEKEAPTTPRGQWEFKLDIRGFECGGSLDPPFVRVAGLCCSPFNEPRRRMKESDTHGTTERAPIFGPLFLSDYFGIRDLK